MIVRFIIGRAGSGKTRCCITAIREELSRDAVQGPRLIFLVPEQAALQSEREIIRPESCDPELERKRTAQASHENLAALLPDVLRTGVSVLRAAHRAEVVSFQRLAHRILESASSAAAAVLSTSGRAMAVRRLLSFLGGRLRYYRRWSSAGWGLFHRLGATLGEFLEEAVLPEDLEAIAFDEGSGTSAAKVHDLALLYRAYLTFLGEDWLDPAQLLSLARARMDACSWIQDSLLWVDGFASVSREETLTLLALARRSRRCHIAVMIDPAMATGDGSNRERLLFRRIGRLYATLRDAFLDAGFLVEEPLLLDSDPPPRFRNSQPLAQLERSIFSSENLETASGGGEDRSVAKSSSPSRSVLAASSAVPSPTHAHLMIREEPRPDIRIVEAPSRRIEVELAAATVRDWVHGKQGSYRYRDIAIIVRGMDAYADLLVAALSSRGIPFFIDRRRPIDHHPMIEFLRASVGLLADPMGLDSIRCLLRTGFTPLSDDEADLLENFLLRKGIAGVRQWELPWDYALDSFALDRRSVKGGSASATIFNAAGIEAARRRLMEYLQVWRHVVAQNATMSGQRWGSALKDWLLQGGVSSRMHEWAMSAQKEGDADQAQEHRQVWTRCLEFIAELEGLFQREALTARELADALESGFAAMTLGLAPPMLDQVLVGSIDRSRHPDIQAAIVMGFQDGIYPMRWEEDSILHDAERFAMQRAGLSIQPPGRVRVGDEQLSAYAALTRASRELILTYSTSEAGGKACSPSPMIQDLRWAVPGLEVERVDDPLATRRTWSILTRRDLVGALIGEFRRRPPLATDDPSIRRNWNALYQRTRIDLGKNPASASWFRALAPESEAKLSAESALLLHGERLVTSVSKLESFAACPFRHFAERDLEIVERPLAGLGLVDVGKVNHALMEEFTNELIADGISAASCSEADHFARWSRAVRSVFLRMPSASFPSTMRDRHRLRAALQQAWHALAAQQEAARIGTTRPRAAELAFGFGQKESMAPLMVTTPRGRTAAIRGYVDRVEAAETESTIWVLIHDYKRSGRSLHYGEVAHGLSLQLLTYLLVLKESGGKVFGKNIALVGALYHPMTSDRSVAAHPEDAQEKDKFRPRGIISSDGVVYLDATLQSGRRSSVYSLQLLKDGGTSERSDGVCSGDFASLLGFVMRKLGELADGVMDGSIAVAPFRLGDRSACTGCPFPSVCRIERMSGRHRYLPSVSRSQLFDVLQNESGDCASIR